MLNAIGTLFGILVCLVLFGCIVAVVAFAIGWIYAIIMSFLEG